MSVFIVTQGYWKGHEWIIEEIKCVKEKQTDADLYIYDQSCGGRPDIIARFKVFQFFGVG